MNRERWLMKRRDGKGLMHLRILGQVGFSDRPDAFLECRGMPVSLAEWEEYLGDTYTLTCKSCRLVLGYGDEERR